MRDASCYPEMTGSAPPPIGRGSRAAIAVAGLLGLCLAGPAAAQEILHPRTPELTFRPAPLAEELVTAGPGDFVNVPRGTVHRFLNTGAETARMILTFTPAGMERFFEETLEPAPNGAVEAPDNVDEVAARYVEAAPRHGLRFT